MIYKKLEGQSIIKTQHPLAKRLKKIFNFDEVHELMYEKNWLRITEIQEDERDPFFCSDIASSVFNPFYEYDLRISARIYHALLVTHLQLLGDKTFQLNEQHNRDYQYEFLGLILRDEEINKRSNNNNEYYKEINIDDNLIKVNRKVVPAYSNGVSSRKSHIICVEHRTAKQQYKKIKTPIAHPIKHIFSDNLYEEKVIFTIVGSQTLEWNYARIKKASILIADLINAKIVNPQKIRIILSGRNNATSKYMKVNLSNEADHFRTIFIFRLKKYLSNQSDFDLLLPDCFGIEDMSTNTSENILETVSNHCNSDEEFTAFFISNTFHLPQISSEIKKIETKFRPKNLYLVGAENPFDTFKVYDAEYLKNLYNRIINSCSSLKKNR